MYAANSKRVAGFIFGAVGNFVVERAESLLAVTGRFRSLVGYRISEYFG
jgi:hypothetical protein